MNSWTACSSSISSYFIRYPIWEGATKYLKIVIKKGENQIINPGQVK
jgi:hypothetical protein